MSTALQSSPWLSVWFAPRATIERVLATQPRRHVLLLAALAGVSNVINHLVDHSWTAIAVDWRTVPVIALAGALVGILGLYISAFFLQWGAGMFGGHASRVDMRAVLAWGGVPFAIGLLICLVAFLALKFSGTAGEPALITGFDVFAGALALWAIVATMLMYARVQGFGFWRAIVSAAIAWLLVIFLALSVALGIRAFLYQPFNIPAGSMKPTLLVGDYIFASKYAYGYSHYSLPFSPRLFSGRVLASEPQRGDVVVFRLPRDDGTDYVKRVVGLPGDQIQMQSGVLYINGEAVKRERVEDFIDDDGGSGKGIRRWRETLPNGVTYTALDMVDNGYWDTTQVYHVPPGHYFTLGDNLDNSTDSRALSQVGYIPFENLIGRVAIIFFSIDQQSPSGEPRIRFDRIGLAVR